MAAKFIDKAFGEDGVPKYLEDEESREIQAMLTQTVQKYDRGQVISALKDVMLNDSYERISGPNNRQRMAMLGKKQISDVVMKPLVSELLNERKIIPEKRKALQYAIAVTEQKYPNTGAWRIADTLQRFKESGEIHAMNFTGDSGARDELRSNFRNQKDMEDMIGIICDAYSSQKYLMPDEGNPLHRMLNEGGPDYFRENIIRAKCYYDHTGLYSNEHSNTMNTIPFYDMMQELAAPFVDEARQARFYEEMNRGYQNRAVVRRNEMRAAMILQEEVKKAENIEIIFETQVESVIGDESIEGVLIRKKGDVIPSELNVDGIFVGIGIEPSIELIKDKLEMDGEYIKADETCATSISGIYAVGDIRKKQLRQVITACADGANAITSVQKYLTENNNK